TTRWFPIPMLSSRSMNKTSIVPKPVPTPPRRFQRGSLQKRKSAGGLNWIAFWWQDHHRRSQTLGPCAEMTPAEALAQMAKLLQIMRTHASLSRQAGIDPKLVADQLGHGLGVNLRYLHRCGLGSTSARRSSLGNNSHPGMKIPFSAETQIGLPA